MDVVVNNGTFSGTERIRRVNIAGTYDDATNISFTLTIGDENQLTGHLHATGTGAYGVMSYSSHPNPEVLKFRYHVMWYPDS